MIEKLTNYIVDCQIASGKIKEEEGSVYRYGYTLFLYARHGRALEGESP